MSEGQKREAAVLNAALELSPAERADFLDRACAGDVKFRERMEALLHAHEQAGFMETGLGPLKPGATVRISMPLTEKPGDRIGRYKLLQQIGEGGCGVVYMAEQEAPVRRRVALKVIKLGMDTKEVIARFEAERQALALMDHPHIAKVFDAGATETGRPYFVMELVRGVKITDFCDESRLSTEERLKLFVQVCQAIQHAHQKGIIHRDIKPSNILVTINDGVPVPKVIDFGIAKATAGRLTDQTVFTAFEQFIGTPAYMSPEQAVMTSLDIDTRSDIYSLGVLLYELLVGQTPFDARELMKAGFDEMRRIIRDQEPPRPSTRLSSMMGEELTTTATRRRTEPPKLVNVLSGDLDWIVMKCLEKDRTRRYESANGLAADVQRHLTSEPVSARPPSRLYSFQKTMRRHKLAFVAATVLTVTLLLGAVISTWQAVRATKAESKAIDAQREQSRLRQEAESEKNRAEKEATRSGQVATFMTEMLEAAGPAVARGRDATLLREIMEKTATRIESELTNQIEVQGDLWATLGSTYVDIGDHDNAIKMFGKAVRCYRQCFPDGHVKLAKALGDLGASQSFRRDIRAGTNNAALGLAMARQLKDERTLATCLIRYAQSLADFGQGSPEAVPYLRETLAIRRKFGTNDALVSTISRLAVSVTNAAEGESFAREALAHSIALEHGEGPGTASAHFVLGQKLRNVDRPAEAEVELRTALELWRKYFPTNHPHRDIVFRMFIDTLAAQNKWSEAEIEIQKEAPLNPATDYCVTLQAALQIRQGKWEEAVGILKSVVPALTRGQNVNTATVLALENSLEAYRQQSRRILDKPPAKSDYAGMERTAKATLILPPDEPELRRAGELADAAADKGRDNPVFAPWGSMTKALAEYRRGKLDSALEWSGRSIAATNAPLDCLAMAHLIQALAHGQAGNREAAKSAFVAGDEILKAFRVGGRDSEGVTLVNWKLKETWFLRDWLNVEVLRREAEAAINSQRSKNQ